MQKYCKCGETIRIHESKCSKCKPPAAKILPIVCRRCGREFQPATRFRKICNDCQSGFWRDVTAQLEKPQGAVDNPCDRCVFLARCRVLVHDPDSWPLCYAASPDHDEFVRQYQNTKTLQGHLARNLLALEG